MADLKINTDLFITTKNVYDTSAEKIGEIKKELTKSLAGLRDTGWASDAGKKFFEKYDDSWVKNVDKYITLLTFMSELLVQAKENYEQVIDESKKIKF